MANDDREEQYTTDSGSQFTEYWVDWFLGTKGNEYFCDVDLEYITDKFNLTGLFSEVDNVHLAIELITDELKTDEISEDQGEQLETNARTLYGLIHARYIITTRGLQKMMEKYKAAHFGYCSRVYCQLQHLLPVGLSDHLGVSAVKLYCPKCEDLYNPKSSRHAQIDGAFFGTTFPGMFLQAYPQLVPSHPTARYIPKVFGFNLHEYAQLARWQELQRQKLEKRLLDRGVDTSKNVPNGYFDLDEAQEEEERQQRESGRR